MNLSWRCGTLNSPVGDIDGTTWHSPHKSPSDTFLERSVMAPGREGDVHINVHILLQNRMHFVKSAATMEYCTSWAFCNVVHQFITLTILQVSKWWLHINIINMFLCSTLISVTLNVSVCEKPTCFASWYEPRFAVCLLFIEVCLKQIFSPLTQNESSGALQRPAKLCLHSHHESGFNRKEIAALLSRFSIEGTAVEGKFRGNARGGKLILCFLCQRSRPFQVMTQQLVNAVVSWGCHARVLGWFIVHDRPNDSSD